MSDEFLESFWRNIAQPEIHIAPVLLEDIGVELSVDQLLLSLAEKVMNAVADSRKDVPYIACLGCHQRAVLRLLLVDEVKVRRVETRRWNCCLTLTL